MAGARLGDGLGRAWLRYVQAGTGAFSSQASPADLPSLPTLHHGVVNYWLRWECLVWCGAAAFASAHRHTHCTV
eukprot:4491492-Alexandrium_andersonii.AAC.1